MSFNFFDSPKTEDDSGHSFGKTPDLDFFESDKTSAFPKPKRRVRFCIDNLDKDGFYDDFDLSDNPKSEDFRNKSDQELLQEETEFLSEIQKLNQKTEKKNEVKGRKDISAKDVEIIDDFEDDDSISMIFDMEELQKNNVSKDELQSFAAGKKHEEQEKPRKDRAKTQSKSKVVSVGKKKQTSRRSAKNRSMELDSFLQSLPEKDNAEEEILEEPVEHVGELMEHNIQNIDVRDTRDKQLPDAFDEFLKLITDIRKMKISEDQFSMSQEKFNKFFEYLLKNWTAKEDALIKYHDKLQAECNKARTYKNDYDKKIVEDICKQPKGEQTVDVMLNMSRDTCQTLSKIVADMDKNNNQYNSPVLPLPPDDFTMLSYHKILNEVEKLKRQKEDVKQKFHAEFNKKLKVKFNEIKKETDNLRKFLTEAKQVKKVLQCKLQYFSNESDISDENNTDLEQEEDEDEILQLR